MVKLFEQAKVVENVYVILATLFHLLLRCNIKVDAFSKGV